ncbi:MAG: 4-(cytidine 5'-diphospho)-2-C-methyl-D-erythritol kinase [Planctomycetota bacterium]
MTAFTLAAPAKINLGLRVLGRRDDGYHELVTIFAAIELCDRLVMRAIEEPVTRLHLMLSTDRGLPVHADADNLVVRAAEAFRRAADCTAGLEIRLEKRIPAGAGLGGGSADAAATLVLADALFRGRVERQRLLDLAASLGADVPFFLAGPFRESSACFARGIGERLWPIATPSPSDVVLILPPVGTSTPLVFRTLGASLIDRAALASLPGSEAPTATELALIEASDNQLEPPAMACTPELREIRDRLIESGIDGVRMSGSGSTLFARAESPASAERLARSVRAALDSLGNLGSRTQVIATRILGQPLRPAPIDWPLDRAAEGLRDRPAASGGPS